jgi:hypothetical protein
MKKISLALITLAICASSFAQTYQNDLLRSAGFFISPSLTSFNHKDVDEKSNPRFGLTLGFRFKNEIGKGFFLEGGVGITSFGGRMEPVYDTMIDYYTGDTLNMWRTQNNYSQINITTPFLAGYRTSSGKVRFECAAGFAFNLRLFEFTKRYRENYITHRDDVDRDLHPMFGTSFSALARAGISVPLSDRATLDILPTLRYSFLSFHSESKDAFQCMFTDENKWSAGIDIGFTWKLEDPYSPADYEEVKKVDENAYTVSYGDTTQQVLKPKKTRPGGPKNFNYLELGGNGLIMSLNYERTVYRNDLISVQGRAGFGMIPNNLMIPFGANIAFGKHTKKFELGLGATAETFTDDDIDDMKFKVNLVPSMAFRLETNAHFFLRLGLMSHYFFDTGELLPCLGVSVGGCY